jgi:beta-glucanase (GH16 family)
MKHFYTILLFTSIVLFGHAQVNPYLPDTAPACEIPGYILKWSDEFNGTGAPNEKNWKHETGFVRNEEDQWYHPKNAHCWNGALHILAKRERFKNPNYNESGKNWRFTREFVNYTSSSLKTEGMHSWQFGRFEVRAKIPAVQGSWPAIWTLGVAQEWPS